MNGITMWIFPGAGATPSILFQLVTHYPFMIIIDIVYKCGILKKFSQNTKTRQILFHRKSSANTG